MLKVCITTVQTVNVDFKMLARIYNIKYVYSVRDTLLILREKQDTKLYGIIVMYRLLWWLRQ